MSKHHLTRRAALKSGAAAVAVGCAPGGGKGRGDSATPPGRIDHIVVVMMENRSFDHWYGARRLLEDRTEEDGLTAEMSNPDPLGVPVSPFASTEPCLSDPPHGWTSSRRQFNAGANDGFCAEYAARIGGDGAGVMAYQRREDIPISFALADAYTNCDRWFSSVMGPTWPNRLYAHLASSQGYQGNAWPADTGGFTDKSIWQALDEADLEWRYYYSDLPFIGLLRDHWNAARCKLVEKFFADCADGDLPAVTWVDPAFAYNDNHPPHHPARGELFIGAVYEALATSPAWDRTLLVLTYDEHGGFFDHVPPPTTEDERALEGFDQMGFRVPTVLIGPWVRPGVDHTVYDHTSWIRFALDHFGIELWNERLRAANSIEAALDKERMASGDPRPPVELPAFSLPPAATSDSCDYSSFRPPAHLNAQVEWCERHDIPTRFLRPEQTQEIMMPILRRRGLIG